jgi:hypothetical protein
MKPDNIQTPDLRVPSRAGPDPGTAERRLALLANWRSGTLATAIVMAGVLPFAIAWRVNDLIAIAASIIFAAILAISTHLARRRWLATIALSPELVRLPDLAAERRRLQSVRTRRALAIGLRRTADPIQPPCRFDPCPVLPDRAAAVRDQLLELANALEQTPTPDPACVALIRELLTNGTGPLYNPNLPAGNVQTTLTRARAGIIPHPPPERQADCETHHPAHPRSEPGHQTRTTS